MHCGGLLFAMPTVGTSRWHQGFERCVGGVRGWQIEVLVQMFVQVFVWSEREDLNLRPPPPEDGALPG